MLLNVLESRVLELFSKLNTQLSGISADFTLRMVFLLIPFFPHEVILLYKWYIFSMY